VVEDWFTRPGRTSDNRIDEVARRARTSATAQITACAPSAFRIGERLPTK
jgi:hypothetical protein